jgi:hypothetical protein
MVPSITCGWTCLLRPVPERRLPFPIRLSDEKNRCMQVWHRYGHLPVQHFTFSAIPRRRERRTLALAQKGQFIVPTATFRLNVSKT